MTDPTDRPRVGRSELGRYARFFLRDYPLAVGARARGRREREVPAAWSSGEGAPIVLLPGVYETWNFLRPIGERLSAAGHPVIALPELKLNTEPIRATAGVVWREIVARDLREVILVAHSKGGLVGKHLLAIDDTEQRIQRMVAVATPFAGSSLARLAPNRALRDFRIDDPTVLALAAERRVDARITSVFPVIDPHIPGGSRLDGARNVQLRMGGHFGPILSPAGIAVVVREVERGDSLTA